MGGTALYLLPRELRYSKELRPSLRAADRSLECHECSEVRKLAIELVSLKLGPSYSTTTSTRIEIFGGAGGRPAAPLEWAPSSSPEAKYEMASVRSASVRTWYSSPSSSVYVSTNGHAERAKHSSTCE